MTAVRSVSSTAAVVLCFAAIAIAQAPKAVSSQATVRWHDVSIDDYRQHLVALSSLVDACASARNSKACDPTLIGPDDRIAIVYGPHSEQRLIRYGWLRVLFSKAEDPDPPAGKSAVPKRIVSDDERATQDHASISQLLKDAKARLDSDLAQSHAAPAAPLDHAQERESMRQVLAGPDFRNLEQQTVRDSVLEKFGNWLNRLFESASNLKARSAWVGRVLVWGFILGVCVALVYSLLRLERRWRIQLTPEDGRPAPGAASARDWQLWLEDARRAASSGLWREAIHFVYWAAISRLESRRLWPADRARTPREYLALVAQEDPRKPSLSQLTGAFERFWYGGRTAAESDYRKAEHLATLLISGTPSGAVELPSAQEGGAR